MIHALSTALKCSPNVNGGYVEMDKERTATIAKLNDEFRKGGQGIMLTQGVQTLPDVLGLIKAVENFDMFTPDNDPWGEHDFGSIVWHNNKIFWKVDYYDQALKQWHDPLAPDCRRVLTVMLASEY